MHGLSLPDDSAGSFFVIGGNPFGNRRHTAKYIGTYREYTGAYRAIDGVCDAGPFRPIGVIMPISLSILRAVRPYRYA